MLCLLNCQIEVESEGEYVVDPDRGRQHQGRSGMVLRQAAGLHLQSEGQEGGISLSVHLGKGHSSSWKQWRCPG